MSLERVLLVVGTAAAVIGAVATVAGLQNEARARLVAWTRHAGRWLWFVFVVAAICNSIAGIILFGIQNGLPTRGDILALVLHLFNLFFISSLALSDAALRLRERARRRKENELSLSITSPS